MVHRAAPISVSVALDHTSANAVKATARGWSTGSFEYLKKSVIVANYIIIFKDTRHSVGCRIRTMTKKLKYFFISSFSTIPW